MQPSTWKGAETSRDRKWASKYTLLTSHSSNSLQKKMCDIVRVTLNRIVSVCQAFSLYLTLFHMTFFTNNVTS